MNIDANNRQLHPTEAQLIRRNAGTYAQRRGISIEKALSELTQQALQNIDTAWDARLGSDNLQAQAFLKEMGQGQNLIDSMTGQRYQLFAADEATRNNHAQFAQYVKTDLLVRSQLDVALRQTNLPKGAQAIDRRGMSGSDMALNDAARDYGHMKAQPEQVQWAVLAELRQTRAQNQSAVAKLEQERTSLAATPQNTQQRWELQQRIDQLQDRDQALLRAAQRQILVMGSGGLLNQFNQRETFEGFGAARASAGLNFKGMGGANIGARLAMAKEAAQEAKAIAAAERAIARTKVELNARVDDAQQFEINIAPKDVPETVLRRDNDFWSGVNHRGQLKATLDAEGNLISANPQGTGSIADHVRGGNAGNTPYISTTDPKAAAQAKNYGAQEMEISTRDLQRDINMGTVRDVEIVPPQKVQAELQNRIDSAQARYEANPSDGNLRSLERVRNDLSNAVRDGECLVKPCVPAAYIRWPAGIPDTPKASEVRPIRK